jgi:hypothetical protein
MRKVAHTNSSRYIVTKSKSADLKKNKYKTAIYTGLLGILTIGIVVGALVHFTYAASGSLSLSPSSGSYQVGNDVTVTLNENSGTDSAIGVDAFIDYPSNELQFVSATTVAPFSVAPPDTASSGVLEITRGAYSGVTGAQTVSVVTFKVLAAGTANVTISNSSSSLSPSVGSNNLLTTSSGGSFSLSAPSTTVPSPTPTPVPTPTPTPSPSKTIAPAPVVTSNPKSTSVSVSAQTSNSSAGGTTAGVTVPNDGAIAVTTPVSVQPTTEQSDGVTKVVYYLNGKPVDTETKAPFTYNIDTSKLKNGTYPLTTKTYYSNGTTKQSVQHLIVRNAEASKSYGWIYTLVGILIVLAIGFIFIRRRGNGLMQAAVANHNQADVTGDKVTPYNPAHNTFMPSPIEPEEKAVKVETPEKAVEHKSSSALEPGQTISPSTDDNAK